MKSRLPRLVCTLLVSLLPLFSLAEGRKIHLKILDEKTEHPVSNCRVSYTNHLGNEVHAYSSEEGEVTIEKYSGTYLEFNHLNFHKLRLNISTLEANKNIVRLTPKDDTLREVTVYSAYKPSSRGNQFSYTPLQAESSISVMGEPDVLRHISSLPGVSQGVESTLGLFVRGGNSGSNGLYFNDVPLYVSSHLAGMVSVYPPDMIEDVTFQMGGISACKGNLSSSLLDVALKRDYGTPFSGKATLSPYLSGIYASIPLIKDRLSLQVAGRTSFAPYLINMVTKSEDEMKINVYDLTAALNFKVSSDQALEAFLFSTNDYLSNKMSENSFAQNWRALIGKIGWEGRFGDDWKFKAWAYYNASHSSQVTSTYKGGAKSAIAELGISSGLEEWALNVEAQYRVSDLLSFNFGSSWHHQSFTPGSRKFVHNMVDDFSENKSRSRLLSLFSEVKFTPLRWLELQLGYRHVFQSGEEERTHNFDLHALSHIVLNQNVGVELSFDRMTQYYHIMEGLPTGWSLNILTPSTSKMPVEVTHQYYGGLFYNKRFQNISLNSTLGIYHRTMNNVITYVNSRNAFGLYSENWEKETDVGRGSSYGIELSASFTTERLGTTLAYTLSKTDRTFPKVNDGRPFPFKFDRRHILNLQTKYTFHKHQSKRGTQFEHIINGVLSYSSGNRVTLPVGYYQGVMPPYWSQLEQGRLFPGIFYHQIYDRQRMSEKNALTMKDYFRIDLAYTFKRIGRKTVNELSLSVFNILNRHNPYTYFRDGGEWKQLSIVPIMPSIRWSVSW